MKKYLKVFAALGIFSLVTSLWAEESTAPSLLWQNVLSGKVISEPARLSYGFCVITDARKIDCLNWEGKKIWEKEAPHPRECTIFKLDNDFILLSDNFKSSVSLINPSGIRLWETEITFKPENAISGLDGRIFIYNGSNIACLGINGIIKWKKEADTKSESFRFTPFGKLSYQEEDGENSETLPQNHKLEALDTSEAETYNTALLQKQFKDFSYAFFYDKKHALICKNDWTLEYYYFPTEQNIKALPQKKKSKKTYKDFYNLNNINSNLTENKQAISDERIEILQSGNYGEKEIRYASEALNIFNAYTQEINLSEFGTQKQYSTFEANTKEFERVICQIPLFGGKDFTNISAEIVSHSKNFSILKNTMREFGKCAYDPDFQVLTAIETRAKTINRRNEDVIVGMCDAVYEICRFMGRDAYHNKGKKILVDFLYPTNPDRIKAYARKTFEKIKELEM